jgi:hypothetical protein
MRADSRDDVDGLRAQIDAARAQGLTHLTVLTMNQGRTPREHVDAVQSAAAALAAG